MIPKSVVENGLMEASTATYYGVALRDMTRKELIAAVAQLGAELREARIAYTSAAGDRAKAFLGR